jgi:hypothetical protein
VSARNFDLCSLLDDLFLDGASVVGRRIGVPKTTIAEWRADLGRWKADKLLALADADERVRLALIARLGADAGPTGDRPERAAREVIKDAGTVIADLMTALDDERISTVEARRHLNDIRRLSRDVQTLERVLVARSQEGRR